MKPFFVFLLFLLLSYNSNCQIKNYRGIVVDQFENRIDGVTITNLRTNNSTQTDCKGRFKISLNRGDSISITKDYYLYHLERVNDSRKINITLNYDTFRIKKILSENRKNNKEEDSDNEYCGCQPLFIVDGKPFISSGFLDMEESAIRSVDVIKGLDARNMLGKSANNGIVFITTNCLSN